MCRDCAKEDCDVVTKLRRRDYAVDPLYEVFVSGNYEARHPISEHDPSKENHNEPSEILGLPIQILHLL